MTLMTIDGADDGDGDDGDGDVFFRSHHEGVARQKP